MELKNLCHVNCCAALFLCACALLCSCGEYSIRAVTRPVSVQTGTSPFEQYPGGGSSVYSWKKKEAGKVKASLRKYYIVMRKSGPVADMNNMAVSLAERERYFEAEIILKQALAETRSEPALHNNLGVVYEMTGRAGPASEEYLDACMLDDRSREMRANFLGLQEIPVK